MPLAVPAHAQADDPWSVSFDLGAQVALSGDAHGGASGRVLGLATTVNAKSYGDVFGPGFYWQAGVGYKLRPNGELRIAANYTANNADRLQVGTVAGLALNAAFHDYKAAGIDRSHLARWSKEVGWETLLNRAGTTFRKLPDADKEGLTEKKAIALMLAQPSMIKRPVLERDGALMVGFKPEVYAKAFG
mgnify:CR=1 FL=1